MSVGTTLTAIVSGGLGFIIADGLDRFMATYNPSATTTPTNKFTSTGAGTLGNTLNVASRPDWKRGAVAAAAVAVPAAGAYFVKNKMAKAAFEGMLVGTGISALRLLVQNVVMPLFIGKDTSNAALQKSYIARLYPAETAAKISIAQKPSSTGVLSDKRDVGPHALADSPRYADASQALRRQAGVQDYPDAAEAMRRQAGVQDYPSAADAMRREAGVSAYTPGPPPGQGPGPKAAPHTDPSCGCVGEPGQRFASFLGDKPSDETFIAR